MFCINTWRLCGGSQRCFFLQSFDGNGSQTCTIRQLTKNLSDSRSLMARFILMFKILASPKHECSVNKHLKTEFRSFWNFPSVEILKVVCWVRLTTLWYPISWHTIYCTEFSLASRGAIVLYKNINVIRGPK